MRLQKFLAHAGVCSRRRGEVYILEGRVSVNHKVVISLGTKIDPEIDLVEVDKKPIVLASEKAKIYIALNKPAGVVSSCSHPGEKVVVDLIDIKDRVYPIGRLDKDSVGLLLLTDDGNLHNRLSHPSFDHEKEYVVETTAPINDEALAQMAAGIVLDGKITRKARVRRLSDNRFNIVLKQGINRQIRRMVTAVGNRVKLLKRVRMGSVRLGNLGTGKWRYLTDTEVRALKE
ncbi:RluB [Desulforapulum autotrophicum HRM2]|uniref:Pseudouridine synthase n=1 Tax=Desulforapulum autotrophicum (strain ATCC 43914 / DSM 3382 / VKM B-1955 / HRM2) TaxID=177437 RepID=C0QEH6_DESAH|nr:pseudouridine synthase [Desulforapulum autotrophicum]ACN15318.1 RluB [Desulforapulum autotrophicum HRM2]